MGKLAIISDLHADINQLGEAELSQLAEVLREQQITRLHLAGDTANKVKRLLEVVAFLEQQLPVSFNFGNHEMPSLTKEADIEHFGDQRFLNQRWLALNDKQVLLAFNGWYDYSFALETDIEKIVATKKLYWYDRFIHRSASDPEIQQEILVQLQTVLAELAQQKKQVILATHFVPKREFIVYQKGRYERWNELNAFLGSEKTGALLDRYDNLQQVVFGHTHRRFDEQLIKGTTYSCRPFGYYFEWQLTREFALTNQLVETFNPMKIRSVLKANQEAFAVYRRQHLPAEFARGMTIIDY